METKGSTFCRRERMYLHTCTRMPQQIRTGRSTLYALDVRFTVNCYREYDSYLKRKFYRWRRERTFWTPIIHMVLTNGKSVTGSFPPPNDEGVSKYRKTSLVTFHLLRDGNRPVMGIGPILLTPRTLRVLPLHHTGV